MLHTEEKHRSQSSGVGSPQALQGGKGSSPASMAPSQPHNDRTALARGALHATRSAGMGTMDGSLPILDVGTARSSKRPKVR